MQQDKLEHCTNRCCLFINGKPASEAEYEEAKKRHPGSYPGVEPGGRNAVLETMIACRKSPTTTKAR